MKKSIYLVEDNTDIREFIELLLVKMQYEVLPCATAEALSNRLKIDVIPDLIILDIMLPDGNGVEICSGLKGDVNTRNIPVLLMSANHENRSETVTAAAEDYIEKPFNINDFMERVERLVN